MNTLDRTIAYAFPGWAERRARARYRSHVFAAAYEAARPTRLRKGARDEGGGIAVTRGAVDALRNYARHLERNHDIARGALDILVRNTVGANGITIEPQPRNADGSIDTQTAAALLALWTDWWARPEVSWTFDWPHAQRMLARSLFRDGEVLFQEIAGPVPYLDHGSKVPYSLELLEADFLPLNYDDLDRNVVQGVERNAWGRAVAYHVYKQHPGDAGLLATLDRKRVSADSMRHIAMRDRIGQVRGISIFASVLARLDDVKDYEESERIAAKVAASMAAVIKKGAPDIYGQTTNGDDGKPKPRELKFAPGMIFDDLLPGESIETIDSSRPNAGLKDFRDGQLRAVSAGVGVSYSSMSKNYDGTYSAQRQELVEQWGAYGVLQQFIGAQCIKPVWRSFVGTAINSGLVRIPRAADLSRLYDAHFIGPSMPWIDPYKEMQAMDLAETAGYMSGPEIIRRRGATPSDVIEQESAWLEQRAARGLPPRSTASTTNQPAPTAPGAEAA